MRQSIAPGTANDFWGKAFEKFPKPPSTSIFCQKNDRQQEFTFNQQPLFDFERQECLILKCDCKALPWKAISRYDK